MPHQLARMLRFIKPILRYINSDTKFPQPLHARENSPRIHPLTAFAPRMEIRPHVAQLSEESVLELQALNGIQALG